MIASECDWPEKWAITDGRGYRNGGCFGVIEPQYAVVSHSKEAAQARADAMRDLYGNPIKGLSVVDVSKLL